MRWRWWSTPRFEPRGLDYGSGTVDPKPSSGGSQQTSAFDSATDTRYRELYTDAMKRCCGITRRTRLRLTLLAVLALLCQQVAFAAYVCPAAAMPATDTAMSAGCHAMPVAAAPDSQHATTVCLLHCAQPTTVTNNVQSPSVPPLLLPAALPVLLSISTLPIGHAAYTRAPTVRTPGLPPPLRYRVLLI